MILHSAAIYASRGGGPASEAVPLAAKAAVSHNFPVQLTSFVGRGVQIYGLVGVPAGHR